MDKWYQQGVIGTFLKKQVIKHAPAILGDYIDNHKDKYEEKLRQKIRVVPGDAEFTDPMRGTAGIGGSSPFIWDPEGNPKGLGYIQSQPKDE